MFNRTGKLHQFIMKGNSKPLRHKWQINTHFAPVTFTTQTTSSTYLAPFRILFTKLCDFHRSLSLFLRLQCDTDYHHNQPFFQVWKSMWFYALTVRGRKDAGDDRFLLTAVTRTEVSPSWSQGKTDVINLYFIMNQINVQEQVSILKIYDFFLYLSLLSVCCIDY